MAPNTWICVVSLWLFSFHQDSCGIPVILFSSCIFPSSPKKTLLKRAGTWRYEYRYMYIYIYTHLHSCSRTGKYADMHCIHYLNIPGPLCTHPIGLHFFPFFHRNTVRHLWKGFFGPWPFRKRCHCWMRWIAGCPTVSWSWWPLVHCTWNPSTK